MFGTTFYNSTIKRYIAAFGTLFNNINITREDVNTNQTHNFKVPIAYGPRQKFLARLDQDANLDRPQAITLPRMSFEMQPISYDVTRSLPPTQEYRVRSPNNSIFYQSFTPVAYNIPIELSIMTKYMEDGLKIVEQIVPFFKPDFTVAMQHLDLFEDAIDVPIVLESVSMSDEYESTFQERRVLIWTLSFVVKGFLFGPTTNKKVIKFTNSNIFSSLTATVPEERVSVYPGLTANDDPANFTSAQVIQATANAVISSNSVSSVNISNNGLGYSQATVTFSDPETGSNTATGTVVVQNYKVTDITITNPGDGYASAPNVTISAPNDVSINYTLINNDDDWDYIVIVEDV